MAGTMELLSRELYVMRASTSVLSWQDSKSTVSEVMVAERELHKDNTAQPFLKKCFTSSYLYHL